MLRRRLGTSTVEVVSVGGAALQAVAEWAPRVPSEGESPGGEAPDVNCATACLASHRRATPGSGTIVRDPAHRAALESEVLGAFSSEPRCVRKANRPPGPDAKTEATKLMASGTDEEVVVSLAAYQDLINDTQAVREPGA